MDDKTSNLLGITPLIVAIANGHVEIVRYLLEQGADRDKASNGCSTPLHWAAKGGYLEIAMLLMSYGADLNARRRSCSSSCTVTKIAEEDEDSEPSSDEEEDDN